MIEVAFSTSFKRSFKRISKNKSTEKKFWSRLEVFINNPGDVRLKTHKLSGKLKDLWSFSVEYDVRVIFYFVDKTHAVFVDIGTHNEVY
jgi:addiction module RelE/StbE family toxin